MLKSTTTGQEVTMSARSNALSIRLSEIVSPAFRAEFLKATKRQFANSSEFRRRKARFFAFQGGICVKCGGEMAALDSDIMGNDFPEMAHNISAKEFGNVRAGYVFGNIALWHRKCNRDNGEMSVKVSDLVRADLVPMNISELPKIHA